MKEGFSVSQKLKEVGATDDMIALYERYLVSDNKKGQRRLLCRCRRIEREKLCEDREKLSRLDYIIAKVKNTCDFQSR